jgi:hypothetical protein
MHHATIIAVTQPDTQAEHRYIADYAWSNIVGLCPSLEGLNDTD